MQKEAAAAEMNQNTNPSMLAQTAPDLLTWSSFFKCDLLTDLETFVKLFGSKIILLLRLGGLWTWHNIIKDHEAKMSQAVIWFARKLKAAGFKEEQQQVATL